MNLKLIASDERERVYTKFDLSDMLRGDSASRAAYYDTLVKAGIMTINEVRAAENLNPVANGSESLVQINQIALSQIDEYSKKVSSNAL
jgi:phage portal protein BeeE